MSSIDSSAHALAGGIGSIGAMALLYPLERCRILLQVHKYGGVSDEESVISCLRSIVRNEGFKALYRGLSSSLVGVGVSSTLYFYWYAYLKSLVSRDGNISAGKNMIVAAISGVINVVMTTPIWVIQTRLAIQKKNLSMKEVLLKALKQEGIAGLYKGLFPALVLVSNPAIQFAMYDQLIKSLRLWRRGSGHKAQLTALEIFVLGATAKAIATLLTYPYQVVKSRMQVSNEYKSVSSAFARIYSNEGVTALFSGFSAKLWQTMLNSALMFLLYEKLVSTFRLALSRRRRP